MAKISSCSIISIVVLALIGIKIPGLLKFIDSQNKFFDEVQVFTPDLEGLEMRRMQQIETDDKVYEILDPNTNALKETGWMKRDKDIKINREAVWVNPENNWL